MEALRRARVAEVGKPCVGHGGMPVRVRSCGVYATDRHIFKGVYLARYSVVPGHEIAGEVAEVGDGVKNISVGDRVAADPNIPCNACRFRGSGKKRFCENWGSRRHGARRGFAEYVKDPSHVVYPGIPDNTPLRGGRARRALACVIHGLDIAEPWFGMRMALLSAGSMGLFFIQLLRRVGALRYLPYEPDLRRAELTKELSADEAVGPNAVDPEGAVCGSW